MSYTGWVTMLVVRSVFSAISLILGNATQCGRLRSARPEVHTHPGVGADEIHLPRGLGNYPDCPDFILDVSVHSLPHRVQDDPGQTDFQKCLVSSCTSQTHVLKKLLESVSPKQESEPGKKKAWGLRDAASGWDGLQGVPDGAVDTKTPADTLSWLGPG